MYINALFLLLYINFRYTEILSYKSGNSWVFPNGPPAKPYPRLISSSFQPFGTAPMWKKAGLSFNAIPIFTLL